MTKADPKLHRALGRLRLGTTFLQAALRGQQLRTILRLRKYVDESAGLYRAAADSAPNDLHNSILKIQGVAALIVAKKTCDEASAGLRCFMEVV